MAYTKMSMFVNEQSQKNVLLSILKLTSMKPKCAKLNTCMHTHMPQWKNTNKLNLSLKRNHKEWRKLGN